jgi:tRNA(Ile)-lysidine synthase
VFLAAVSGGADSTAMLAALVSLRDRGLPGGDAGAGGNRSFELRGIHVEHGIRPAEESRGDAAAVAALCGNFGVPLRVVPVPPGRIARTARRRGIGLEAAARLYRHRAWNGELRRLGAVPPAEGPVSPPPFLRVLVAHTMDDLLETALMRVFRGAGPAGLAAMPPRRGRIIRPLLKLGRVDVLAYLEERRIPWRTDQSNGDNRFFRNRIRNLLVPCLEGVYPSYRRTLLAMAETQSLAASFLAAEARRRCLWEQVPGHAAGAGIALETGRENFFSLPEIIREEALFRGLDLLGAGRPRYRRAVIRLFCEGRTARADLGGAEVLSEGSRVILVPGTLRSREDGFSLLIKAPGFYTLEGVSFELRRAGDDSGGKNFFASLPLCIRPAFPEDALGAENSPEGSGRAERVSAGSFRGEGPVLIAADAEGVAAFLSFRKEAGGGRRIRVLRGREKGGIPFFLTGGV